MPARPLCVDEREEIRVGIAAGVSIVELSRRLGRHRSTIHREIARNGGRDRYCAVRAQRRADTQLSRPKLPKLLRDPVLAAEVTSRLEAKDSPMRISIELAAQGQQVSHECIYQAIHHRGRGLRRGLWDHLHLRRRRRRCRGVEPQVNSHSLGEFALVHDRPDIAADRIEVGHLEGDLIVGAYNRSALVTVFDRASRHLWLSQIASKNADDCLTAVTALLERIPVALRRTLTWDQGAEMAHHRDIAQHSGIAIYFAEPKSPWQRPTNEAGNALVRRYVGKGTDLNQLTPDNLRHIEHRINTIPRRSLNWATAHATYTAAVALID